MEIDVFVKESDYFKTVDITGLDKPKVSNEILGKWQRIINLVAKIVEVPAVLLLRITEENLEIFLKSSNNDNPYVVGGSYVLGQGLYGETVIGTDSELHVSNSMDNEMWKDNTDKKLNMISYFGLPIKWRDGEFFGTICMLDNKTNEFAGCFKQILKEFKLAIETDLELSRYEQKLEFYADTDILTNVYNRRKTEDVILNEYSRSRRSNIPFSLAVIDLNKFKKINDNYGHIVGDEMLKTFAREFKAQIRSTDIFGRWGGDEFILVCPNTDCEGIKTLIHVVKNHIVKEMNKVVPNSGFCYGCSEYKSNDREYQNIVKRADEELYKYKRQTW